MVEYGDLCLLGPTLILHETADTLCCPRDTGPREGEDVTGATFKVEG